MVNPVKKPGLVELHPRVPNEHRWSLWNYHPLIVWVTGFAAGVVVSYLVWRVAQ